MGTIKRALATLAGAGMLLTGGVATAAPAAAAVEVSAPAVTAAIEAADVSAQAYPWLDRSHMTSATSLLTPQNAPYGTDFSVQVPTGIHNGIRYGWARGINTPLGYIIRFEVDTDGVQVWNTAATRIARTGTAWTNGYATSSSSDRAFRACVMRSVSTCGTASQVVAVTNWW